MRSPRSALLLVPVLLAGAMPARAQAPTCQAGAPQLELTATPEASAELCIRPGRVTTLLFDSPLVTGGVVLEGRGHFREVEAAGKVLVLMPSERLPKGARLGLEVRFADGHVPASARFTLVAHPEQAAQQVEVTRPRSAAFDWRAEAERLKGELERCQAQPVSPAAPPSPTLAVAQALAHGKLDDTGLTIHLLGRGEFSQRPGGELQVRRLTFYRSSSVLTLEVLVKNADPHGPWALEGATLVGRNGLELPSSSVYPGKTLAPGAVEKRWVAWELPPAQDKEAGYTLHLWEAGRARAAVVTGLKLP